MFRGEISTQPFFVLLFWSNNNLL